MSSETVKTAFDSWADVYDRSRRQLVPCFDDFYGTILRLIGFEPDAAFHALDLGAGTGLLSALLLARFPRARVTLLDISDAMLDKARERFAGQPYDVAFAVADYASAPLPGRFDVVMSALSIHHLTDAGKAALFAKVQAALVPGGMFMNADQVLGATPEIERRYRQQWLHRVRECGVSDADLAAALERMKEDQMAPLAAQLRWLEDAGFVEVDCWYKSFSFAVFGGRRDGGGRTDPWLETG